MNRTIPHHAIIKAERMHKNIKPSEWFFFNILFIIYVYVGANARLL